MTPTATIRPEFADALGASDRVCVDVDRIVATEDPEMAGQEGDVAVFDVRSGEFLTGNFASVVGQWATFHQGVAKIYWIPLDRGIARTEGLTVVVESMATAGSPSETLTFGGDGNYSMASGGAFWPSGIRFPHPGQYRLTASSPGHWGCFELTV